MKIEDIRVMPSEELKAKRLELSKDLSLLRYQNATGQLENPIKIRLLRKDIARIKTVINELRAEE